MEIELASGSPADLHPTIGAKRGVVLVADLLGRRALFNELAASLASNHQWHVIVVDIFRDAEFANDSLDERNAAVSGLDDDEVIIDLVDAANRLEIDPVAVVGFDVGGTYALKAAAALRFDRLVSFYGLVRLPAQWRGPNQREPLELLAHVEDPETVMAVVGTDDVYLPSADVDELVARGVKVARYPGAKHGFVHDPAADNYRHKDALDAWAQVIEHLRAI